MKRSLKTQNSNDGKFLKKIKMLSNQLNNEEKEECVSIRMPVVTKTSMLESDDYDMDSEDEDENEIVHSLSENEELKEDDRKILEKYNHFDIATDIVNGMHDAKSELPLNLEIGDIDTLDFDSIDGYDKNLKNIIEIMSKLKKEKNLPKYVKVLPQIKYWRCIIDQLEFLSWTPAAVKLMAAKFRAKGGEDAEIFYREYLLKFVRGNISMNHRLDDLLFQTLRQALYRRKEFMKGLLLPWCKDSIEGKEAEVLSNVIQQTTVKSDVGILAIHILITKMDYSKGRLLVLRSFLEKKYALPIIVIKELSEYFFKVAVGDCDKFLTEKGLLPLIWFQTLNLFVSLNYMYLSDDDLKMLLKVCSVQKHEKVTPAIMAYLKMRSTSAMETQ